MALLKCVYGLKQASRRFFEKLRGILTRAGYHPSNADPCLYTKQIDGEFTMISVVVDDLLIASNSAKNAESVISALRKAGLEAKNLGFPSYIVGIHIGQQKNGDIELSQSLYLSTILERFDMKDAHPADTPADPNVKLSSEYFPTNPKAKEQMNKRPYRSLIGALLYMTLTRPDIAVAVNECCRYLESPGVAMWTAGKRILRYLKGTVNKTLHFNARTRQRGNNVVCYVDASYAEDKDTRRSRCGFLLYHDYNLVGWKTILQKSVALSTAEAEYRAATLATKDIVWLRRLLEEIGNRQTKPSVLFEDNQACEKMICNPVMSLRNKHLEVAAHFVRQQYQRGAILPVRIDTLNQRADLLTKNLKRPLFLKHTNNVLPQVRNPLSHHDE